MKITKTQLRRIIREEKALLSKTMTEAATLSSGDYGMLVDAKRMLLTVIANLQDIGGSSVYGDGDDEIMEQLELLYDINNSMASVLGMPGGMP